jgi:hypothetical protein
MARPDDWIDRSVMFATDIYGGDTTGVLEEVDDRGVVVRHEIVEIEAGGGEGNVCDEGEAFEMARRIMNGKGAAQGAES